MSQPKSLDLAAVAVMLMLCFSWAFQQLTVKFALPDIGPLGQGTIRSTGAAILVGAYVLWGLRKTPWAYGMNWLGICVGTLFGAEFIMLFVALVYTDASRAVTLVYTAPFVVALGSHFLIPGEKLDVKSTFGIVLAFVGVAVALNPASSTDLETLKGDLLALAGGIGWGLTTLVIRASKLRVCPPAQVLWYQLAVSAGMFFIAGLWFDDSPIVPMTALTVASILYQTIWVAAITFGIWFALISRYSATKLSAISFVTPLAGAAMGYLILDEQLGPDYLFAVMAVAAGIILVSLPRSQEKPNATQSEA